MERDKKGGGIWTCLHLQWLRVASSHYAYWDGYTQNLVRNGLMDLNKIMDLFTFTMTISLIIALSFLAWLYTKPGKKWLENL